MDKYTVEVRLVADGKATTKIEVTKAEHQLLERLEEQLNDIFEQEDYAPKMYVKRVND